MFTIFVNAIDPSELDDSPTRNLAWCRQLTPYEVQEIQADLTNLSRFFHEAIREFQKYDNAMGIQIVNIDIVRAR